MYDLIVHEAGGWLNIKVFFTLVLYVFGAFFLYWNRRSLLFSYDGDGMSLGRTWGWILFYIACVYWLRYLLGLIPPTTPFPPALENLLYAMLLYEFAKKDEGIVRLIADILISRKISGPGGSANPQKPREPREPRDSRDSYPPPSRERERDRDSLPPNLGE